MNPKRSARQIWNERGSIFVGPTSRGGWTVLAQREAPTKRGNWAGYDRLRIHSLALCDVPEAVDEALEWLTS